MYKFFIVIFSQHSFLFLLVLISKLAFGQTTSIRFHTLNRQNKLADNFVNCSMRDSKGFLWFGTQEGLNRYDGYTFKLFSHQASDTSTIGGNFITALFEDKNKNIWIGTSNDGLSIYNLRTNSMQKFRYGKGHSDLPTNYISCIFQDSRRNIWIGTKEGLCQYRPEKNGFITFKQSTDKQSISSDKVNCIIEDKKANIWIGTENGLNIYSQNKFKRLKHVFGLKNSISSNFIRCMLEDKEGDIWIGTDETGISVLNAKTGDYKQFVHSEMDGNSLSENQVWCLYQDKHANIWVGTINGGLNCYKPKNDNFTAYTYSQSKSFSIPSNSISSILEDNSGNLWLTTHGGGIAFKSELDLAFESYKTEANNIKSLSNNTVRCFFEDQKHQIWIGTDGGGLNLFDKNTGQFKVFKTENGLNSNMITSICEFEPDRICLASWKGGISFFNTQTFKVQSFVNNPFDIFSINSNNIKGVCQDLEGNVWIASHGNGINIYEPAKHRFINQNNLPELNLLQSQWGLGVFVGNKNTIWAASVDGLLKLKKTITNEFKISNYSKDSPKTKALSGDYINQVYVDHNKNILIACNAGLDQYDSIHDCFFNLSNRIGIHSNVKSMVEDQNNNLWITTANQLIQVKKDFSYKLYKDIHQGQFCEKASMKASNGDLYFGSTDGFTIVHPKEIKINNLPPLVYITDFQVFNISQKPGATNSVLKYDCMETKEITLNYQQSSFSFEFVSLHFEASNLNQYFYQLEGFDKKWQTADESRKAYYTNIGFGTYTFKVKASNKDGVWSRKPCTIRITIRPPFWFTYWAYGFYAMLLIFALLGYRRFIIFKERLRTDLAKEREIDSLKTQFFTNVSHELRTPLTLILGPIQSLLNHNANQSEFNLKQLNLIERNAQRLMRLVNQLLDFSKQEAGKTQLKTQFGDIIAFIYSISLTFETLSATKNLLLKCEFHKESLYLWFDADKIEKSLINLLSNAFKNTSTYASITIQTFDDDNFFTLSVVDNGIGIADNEREKIFERFFQSKSTHNGSGTGIGLALTKSFVEMHKGTIWVESELGVGSTFKIRLPMGDTHLSNLDKTNNVLSIDPINKRLTETIIPEATLTFTPKNNLFSLLIVDDNDDIRSYLASNLENEYTIYEAVNGTMGQEVANDKMPDLIVSDVMMPNVDGLEFCKHVKANRQTCHIPVILLTARSADVSKIEGYGIGADDYVVKPFNIELLKARIKNLIENRLKLKDLYRNNISIEPESFTSNDFDSELVKRIYDIIESRLSDSDFNPDTLAHELLMSRSSLYSKIKAISGESVSIFVRNYRLKKAAELLLQQKLSITDIAYKVGFNQTQYFAKCFKEVFGVTPSDYKS